MSILSDAMQQQQGTSGATLPPIQPFMQSLNDDLNYILEVLHETRSTLVVGGFGLMNNKTVEGQVNSPTESPSSPREAAITSIRCIRVIAQELRSMVNQVA